MDAASRAPSSGTSIVLLLAALALTACGGASSPTGGSAPGPTPPPGPSAVVVLDASNFDEVVRDGGGVGLIEFFHPGCSHCQAMEPIVESLAAAFEGRALVGKVDVTVSPEIVNAWAVPGYPTFVVVKDGQEVSRRLGEATYDALAAMILAALGS